MDIPTTIRQVRKSYELYLKESHPDWTKATLKTTVSRAFYLYTHTVTPSFWATLESEDSIRKAKEALRQYLKAVHSSQSISSQLSMHFSALKSLKEYLDSQGGVKTVIGPEYEAESFLYQQAKLVYEERILMESEAVLLTHEEEQALPEGAIQVLKETLPFLNETEQLVNWFLALMNHMPFLLDQPKKQKPFYGILLYFLKRLEEEYGKERFAQALWTLQESLHQTYAKTQYDSLDLRLALEALAKHHEIDLCFDESILQTDFQQDLPVFSQEESPFNAISSLPSKGRMDFSLDERLLLPFTPKQEREKANQKREKDPVVPYTQAEFDAEVFMTSQKSQTLCRLLKRKKNLILQGPPGTGKTYLAKRLAYLMLQEKNHDLICSVQFHANYTYEDFIMGYRPTKTGFALRHGVFYTFCEHARQDPRPHFFIIDEINRGNLAKIFGELFSLLESDKRGQSLPLLYTKEPFSIPENVYLIGMMNTADRSLSSLDFALRRRFAFFDMRPAFQSAGFQAYQKAQNNPKFDRLVHEVKALNQEISEDETLGKGFQIGHSYLMNEKVDEAFLESVVHFELMALIGEYWIDEPERVEYWQERLKQAIA